MSFKRSQHYPLIVFSENALGIIDDYIGARLETFFQSKSIEKWHLISARKIMSVKEIKTFPVSNIYNIIYPKINKVRSGKEVLYALVFDESFKQERCALTGIEYLELRVAESSVIFYIYIDIQDIFNELSKER